MPQIDDRIAAFAASLNDEIRSQAEQGNPYSVESDCFAHKVLEMLGDAGTLEDPEVCVREGQLGGAKWAIAGWASPSSDDEDLSELSLLAILHHDSPDILPVDASDLRRRFELARNFLKAMLAGHASQLDPAADAVAIGKVIHERRKDLRRVTIHIATDGLTQRLKTIESEQIGDLEVACQIWDIERLSRLVAAPQDEIDIDVPTLNDGHGIPCLQVPENDPHYDAYMCVIPGPVLALAYDKFGQRLLELNVRAFLSITGKVNKGIRETIRTQPERFFPYNNGLAMTARRVETRRSTDGHTEIVRIVGLQIVNGGQTTASIHRAWKLDCVTEEVSRVFVQAKLTVIGTEASDDDQFIDMVRSISKYANSQNAVKDDDLEANQPWHVALEQLSRGVWDPTRRYKWYYERARGSYATAKLKASTSANRKREFETEYPRSNVITKTDLAKAWNASNQRPEIVSLGGQKNFKHFMAALGTRIQNPVLDETEYRRIIGRIILFRETTKLVNSMRERIPAFRANVVAYLIAYLAYRLPGDLDFERLWNFQALPGDLPATLRGWAEPIYREIVSSAGSRNVGEWCKKTDCWKAVRDLELPLSTSVQRMVAEESVSGDLASSGAEEAIAVSDVMRVTLDEWRAMQEWVARADVYMKAPGIIASMYRMANSGWSRRPTARQARAACSLIERWRTEKG